MWRHNGIDEERSHSCHLLKIKIHFDSSVPQTGIDPQNTAFKQSTEMLQLKQGRVFYEVVKPHSTDY
jgi:hypothetical protein